MVSALDQAKRALVALLRTLAAAYACSVKVTRDSADAEVRTAYRAVSPRSAPATPDFQGLDARRAVSEIPLRDPRRRRIIIHPSIIARSPAHHPP